MSHFIVSFNNNEEVFAPKTLQQLCTQLCASKYKSILFEKKKIRNRSKLRLNPNLKVPGKILEYILYECDRCCDPNYLPAMLCLCRNVMLGKVYLNRIHLNNCQNLEDSHLRTIMKIKPISLDVNNCPNLTYQALDIINKYGENLESLTLGHSAKEIIQTNLNFWVTAENYSLRGWDLSKGLLNTPKLRRLTIWWLSYESPQSDSDDTAGAEVDFLEWLTRRFIGGLEHLDLKYSKCVRNLDFLLKAKDTLTHLTLHSALMPVDRSRYPIRWDVLTKLCKLKFLDVSYCHIDDEKTGILKNIVESLPKLTHLDLSGRGNCLSVSQVNDGSGRYRIDALSCREQRPLDYVNLVETNASHCQLVPSSVVVRDGDKTLKQLVTFLRYNREGELPYDMIDSLEVISNQTNNKFPWKTVVDLVFQGAGPHHDFLSSSYYVLEILSDALKEAHQLTCSQLDNIFKLIVKELNCERRFIDELCEALDLIPLLSPTMDLWNPPNANILVPALVRAARNVIPMVEFHREISTEEEDETEVCAFFLHDVGLHLCNDLSASVAGQIRTVALKRETLALVEEVMEWNPSVVNLAELYWKISNKIVGSRKIKVAEVKESIEDMRDLINWVDEDEKEQTHQCSVLQPARQREECTSSDSESFQQSTNTLHEVVVHQPSHQQQQGNFNTASINVDPELIIAVVVLTLLVLLVVLFVAFSNPSI